MLEERDQAGRDRCDLVRRDVHQVYLFIGYYREVAFVTRLDLIRVQEMAFIVERGIRLCDDQTLLLFGAQVNDIAVLEIHDAVLYLAVGGFDEAHVADLRIDAQRRNQTDVRSLRSFDRAETAVMRIVYVAHLETGAFARQTTGTEGRQTAFVRHFGQRIGLVHELRKLIRAEERIDHRRKGLRIDQVYGGEHFVVADVHAFADRTRHAHETHAELVGQLFAHRADTAVAQVVDVVHVGFRVDQ